MAYAMRNSEFAKITSCQKISFKRDDGTSFLFVNHNRLLKTYDGIIGGKTGFTNEAGFCLTATAKRGNMRLISAVIGAPDSKTRFNEVSSMFNLGFNAYENKAVLDKNAEPNTAFSASFDGSFTLKKKYVQPSIFSFIFGQAMQLVGF